MADAAARQSGRAQGKARRLAMAAGRLPKEARQGRARRGVGKSRSANSGSSVAHRALAHGGPGRWCCLVSAPQCARASDRNGGALRLVGGTTDVGGG
ncbi:hypothetical protein DVDV_3240 [Desulfovibrio sp. DV]|nr:hypothetical protein DVDV_3240 [Desulfovibrio sp. DV]